MPVLGLLGLCPLVCHGKAEAQKEFTLEGKNGSSANGPWVPLHCERSKLVPWSTRRVRTLWPRGGPGAGSELGLDQVMEARAFPV